MADDNKKKGRNKFIKIFAGLLLVALIVVAIIYFVPTNKASLVQSFGNARENMLLNNSKNLNEYNTFNTKVKNNSRVKVYSTEIESYVDLTSSVNQVMDYYNDFLKYAQSNRTYKNYNGKVISYLGKANSNAKEMNEIISQAVKLTDSKETYLRSSWLNYRKTFSSWLSNYTKAFESLYQIYSGCYGETISINTASKTNMKTVVAYMNSLTKASAALVENDKSHNEISSYNFEYNGIIKNLKTFVNKNIAISSESELYYYQTDIQEKYASINNFLKTNTFESLIETIENDGTFPSSEDKSAEQLLVESYLGGK